MMSIFFIRKPDDVRLPLLEPDSITEDRRFRFEQQPVGSPPLVFNNAWKDHNRSTKISGITPDILFSGADLVVRTAIRERLLHYSIPSLHMHPVVYIDNQGKWHEDFWYLAFSDRFDCWNRSTSEYDQEGPPVRLGGFDLHEVFSYKLDENLFDKKCPIVNSFSKWAVTWMVSLFVTPVWRIYSEEMGKVEQY